MFLWDLMCENEKMMLVLFGVLDFIVMVVLEFGYFLSIFVVGIMEWFLSLSEDVV